MINVYIVIYLICCIVVAIILDSLQKCPTNCKNDYMIGRFLNYVHQLFPMIIFIPVFFFSIAGKWITLIFCIGALITVILWYMLNSLPHVDKQLCFLTRYVNYLCNKNIETDFKYIHYYIGTFIGDRYLYQYIFTIYYILLLILVTYLKFI